MQALGRINTLQSLKSAFLSRNLDQNMPKNGKNQLNWKKSTQRWGIRPQILIDIRRLWAPAMLHTRTITNFLSAQF